MKVERLLAEWSQRNTVQVVAVDPSHQRQGKSMRALRIETSIVCLLCREARLGGSIC